MLFPPCCFCSEHHVGAAGSLIFVASEKAFGIYVISVKKHQTNKQQQQQKALMITLIMLTQKCSGAILTAPL